MADLPELVVADADAFGRWLADHHDDPTGVWLVLAKKGTTEPTSLTYAQALDQALRWGWIDGQVRSIDAATYRQRWMRRRPRSMWSQRNVGYATALIEQGLMQPPGLAEVERAQADGRWAAAYAGPKDIEEPADWLAALAGDPAARATYDVLTSQNRFAILFRLGQIKRADTRARRIGELVAMLARGETFYPQKRTRET
jgi:uncharacterized protein YdeI (YjbR/CyaY-like superfamily)